MDRLNMLRLWRRHHAQRWTVIIVVGALTLTTILGSGALIYAHPAFLGMGSGKATLRGHTIPALAHSKALRATDGKTALDLDIALTPRDQKGLDALITAQSDPKSPQYHQYLTPQQFAARFGPAQATVDAVKAFLTGQGLVVRDVSPNHLIIHAAGSVGTLEQALGVQINDYQLGTSIVHAPANDPTVPSELGAAITGIVGLDNVSQQHMHVTRPDTRAAQAQPRVGGPGGGYTPADLGTAYDVRPLSQTGFDGTGQTVALFELAGYDPNDVNTYRSYYNLGPAKYSNVLVDGATNTAGQDSIEVELDMEVLSAIAPGANQLIYISPNTWASVIDNYNKIVTDNTAKVVSTSWGPLRARHVVLRDAVAAHGV